MLKMRIGVVTHYYKSENYGGNLQAYALVQFLNSLGFADAKQLCYSKDYNNRRIKIKKFVNPIKAFKYVFRKIYYCIESKKHFNDLILRKKALLKFNDESIPHTNNVYNKNNINGVINDFNVFITGSDQVWNPLWCDDVFLLNFVPQNKIKMSYSAGISVDLLTNEQIKIFQRALKTYTAISVRESSGVKLLQPLTEKKIVNVVDPTLLLNANEWNKLCSPRIIDEKYIFCYFLGDIGEKKKHVVKFAKNNNLKIVNMPHLCGFHFSDEHFADYKLYEVSPSDFISLIKHADYVFTDSFHASVFSHIYKRNFFVFNRKGFKAMNDRIYSLTKLFDTGDRFCDSKEKCTLEYIESLPSINYDREFPKFEAMKEKSINFLKDNLKKAEEKLDGIDGI